jgi:AcrR family transcriptional regulator
VRVLLVSDFSDSFGHWIAGATTPRMEQGLRGIRALAQRLGVKPMSIYYYVPNKSAILDGIVDLVFSKIELPAADGDWRSELMRRANSARQVLSRHHWAIGLTESRPSPGPATLRHNDAILGTLRRAGFSVEMTAHAYALLDSYVYGFALQEAAMPFQGADTAADVTEPIMERFRTDPYPHLAEMATEHILQPGYDFGNEFEFGFAVILDALTRSLPETLRASNHIDQVSVGRWRPRHLRPRR